MRGTPTNTQTEVSMNDYPEKCECCGKPLDDKCLYHVGTHKYETEVMIETFAPLKKEE